MEIPKTRGVLQHAKLIALVALPVVLFLLLLPSTQKRRQQIATLSLINEVSGAPRGIGYPAEARLDYMRELIDRGADVNSHYNVVEGSKFGPAPGYTALHFCVMNSSLNLRALHFLLDNGADINARNDIGETPLMLAAGYGYSEVVQVLLSEGATVNLRSNPRHRVVRGRIVPGPLLKGQTALGMAQDFAKKMGNLPQMMHTIRLLKAAGAKNEILQYRLNRSLPRPATVQGKRIGI